MDTNLDNRAGLPSASNWRRYELCHGSYQLGLEAKRLGQEAYRESPEALSGRRCHAAMAGEAVELDETEQTAVNFMRERADDQLARIFGDAPVTELREHRFWFNVGKPLASGRADRVIISGKVALIQDFKFGFREPDPAEVNAQLKFLAVVVALEHSQVHHVIAQIVSGPYGVTEARYDYKELEAAYSDIRATLRKINDPHAGFSPSIFSCRYCPAVNICQATKDLVLPVAKLQHSSLPSGDRAAKLLDECELLERHIDQIRAYYKERMTNDATYSVPGYNLAPGPQRRELANALAARNRLEEFIPASELDNLTSYSIPSLEKLLVKALKLRANEAGPKLAEILGELLTVKSGNLCLKRIKGEARVAALCAGT